MALSVKRITLWRAHVENRPGELARTLEPLAAAGADLRLVMGYRLPESPDRAAIEVHPVTGRRVTGAAGQAGLTASDIPCLLVEGDNRAGLGAAMARGLAEAGINVSFLIAQVVGRRFAAVVGLADEPTATSAVRAIKASAAPPRKARRSARRRRRR